MQASQDFPGTEFLRTRRLVLRGLRMTDIPALTELNQDPEVARWLVEPCPTDYLGVAKIVFHANRDYLLRPGLGVWHTSDRSGRFVGVFALAPIEGSDEVELGTRLLREVWGRLYSVEGARALCDHAFSNVGLPYLVGLCHPRNTAVPAILRRLGFEVDGETLHFGNPALRHVLRYDAWLAQRRQHDIIQVSEG